MERGGAEGEGLSKRFHNPLSSQSVLLSGFVGMVTADSNQRQGFSKSQ